MTNRLRSGIVRLQTRPVDHPERTRVVPGASVRPRLRVCRARDRLHRALRAAGCV